MKKNNTDSVPVKNKKLTVGKIILLFLLVILISLAAITAYIVFFHKPDTGADDPPPFSTEGLNFDSSDNTEQNPSTNESQTPEQTTSQDPTSVPKNEQKIYNFLFVGQDRIALNTDVIMLISFNTTLKQINVLQIPRDTYIELSNYSGKINGLYAQYYINSGSDKKGSLRKLADTLEENLCIKIHNFVHINLDGVRVIVDSIGGVDITLSADTTIGGKKYTAGKHHLNGEESEKFIRHRATYVQADIGRIDAQKIFMSAFIQKIKSNFNLSTISTLVTQAIKNVTTDISLSDAVYYAKQLLGIDMNNIHFMSMIGRGTMSNADGSGLSIYVMVRKNMREMIDRYFNIYNFPISDGIFDKNRVFTSTSRYPHINQYYIIDTIETPDPYDAGKINSDSISIPQI